MSDIIQADIEIAQLVELLPESVHALREKGIVCVLCGEPVWGTLAEVAAAKGISETDLMQIISELNQLKRNKNE